MLVCLLLSVVAACCEMNKGEMEWREGREKRRRGLIVGLAKGRIEMDLFYGRFS